MSANRPTLARVGAVALAVRRVAGVLRRRRLYRVSAVFDDVRGLIEGGEVKAGGLEVGSVEEIEFNEDGMPVVTMKIDDDFRLHQGAFADIRLASNVGA